MNNKKNKYGPQFAKLNKRQIGKIGVDFVNRNVFFRTAQSTRDTDDPQLPISLNKYYYNGANYSDSYYN